MKKIILISIACVFSLMNMQAQESQSTGKTYIPEAGEFSIGLSATPIFNYFGNIFNGHTGNTLGTLAGEPTLNSLNYRPVASVMGKYMYTDKVAIIANIGIIADNATTRGYVQDDKAVMLNPLNEDRLIDAKKVNRTGISILLGGEYRIGSERIQGVFGGGLLFGFDKDRISYTYANPMTEINQHPTTTSFNPSSWDGTKRTLETFNKETNFIFGLATHAGVEYFIVPKVALGATVNLYAYQKRGTQTYEKFEAFNEATGQVDQQIRLKDPGNRTFHLGTENLGGSLYISFYF